ncbi:hypothetical protein F2Q70_00004795 [Brassica cretica]|uniref:Uncharacterized protein n=1 Tax=Brassica cretica TaxID=69181 RepID=A0A8S9IP95_BRACR|nr:hypothetical protein F2Q70_00004795 [Brassica cretica]
MTIDADKDKQTHDGTFVNANAERTPAGNVSTVTTNAVILDQMKEMFASALKKSDEQGKLVASLAKQVETLTEKARVKTRPGPREPAAAEDSISRLRAIGPHGQKRILQVRTLTKQSRQAHNRQRRTFHLPPGATKEAISSGSDWSFMSRLGSGYKRSVRSLERRCRRPSEKNAKPVRSAGRVVRKAHD